jgi:hypothetical protein
VPRRELLRLRAGFLAAAGWGSRRAILGSLERRDSQLARAFHDGVEVVLWFEHDLYDQLQLLDVLALAHEAGASPELVVVGSFPRKPSFRGLGELAPFLGDAWSYAAVAELGVGENRLLESTDDEPLPPAPPLGDAQRFVALPLCLTEAGERVLAGEANRVELLGIDRWVGGTHVTA